jgi:hypothetical protein
LIELRKDWEILLNFYLEKNNINQKVLCEALSKQREKFLGEEKRELAKKEKTLRDVKRKYKESEVLKLLRKYNLTMIYSPEKSNVYEEMFKELEIRLKDSIGNASGDGGGMNEKNS